jgi:hypothetical protein
MGGRGREEVEEEGGGRRMEKGGVRSEGREGRGERGCQVKEIKKKTHKETKFTNFERSGIAASPPIVISLAHVLKKSN